MQYFEHTIESSRDIRDTHTIAKLRDGTYLVEKFKDEWRLLYEGKNWILVTSAWPYSSKHCILFYTGGNLEASAANHLNQTELGELQNLLDITKSALLIYSSELISSWIEDLIIWTNIWMCPWVWVTQTVFRPHFHITLQPRKEWIVSWVETVTIKQKGEIEKIFALTSKSRDFIKKFSQYLSTLNIWWFLINEESMSVDFHLDSQNLIDLMLKVVEVGYRFLNTNYYLPWLNNFICNNETTLEEIWDIWRWSTDNTKEELLKREDSKELITDFNSLGFSVAIIYTLWNEPIVRIKFTDKTPRWSMGSMEAAGHSIVRKQQVNPILPNLQPFREFIVSILKNHWVL